MNANTENQTFNAEEVDQIEAAKTARMTTAKKALIAGAVVVVVAGVGYAGYKYANRNKTSAVLEVAQA